jgi:CTP synthase
VHTALVGKYTKLEDAYASVIKALNHASLAANYKLKLIYIAAASLEDETKVRRQAYSSTVGALSSRV